MRMRQRECVRDREKKSLCERARIQDKGRDIENMHEKDSESMCKCRDSQPERNWVKVKDSM